MDKPEDVKITSAALQIIRPVLLEAGRLALASRSDFGATQNKADGTPVTKIDGEIEALLLDRIRREFPQHRILSEEAGMSEGTSDLIWVIDPLDGTRAYASGLPIWGISVGLLRDDQPLAGAFYLPAVGELYWCDRQGVFLNDAPMAPSATGIETSHAFLAVPSNSHLLYEISFHRLRSFGSTAAHLAYVLRGAAVGALTRQVRIWDIAGVLPMLWTLGIELRYLSGAHFEVAELLDRRRASEPILAAPAHVIDYLQTMIRPRGSC